MKTILLVYQPWRPFSEGLGAPIVTSLRNEGYNVDYLDISSPPPFTNNRLWGKICNVIRRIFLKDYLYYLKLEKRHYNQFYLNQLKKISSKNKKNYDCILVIRPDEYTPKFFKSLKKRGDKICGYIWDGIHTNWISDLKKNTKYVNVLYSFDRNDIRKYPQLSLQFATNFYMDHLVTINQVQSSDFQFLYVGGIGTTDLSQRRDILLNQNFGEYLKNSKIIIQYDNGYIKKEEELSESNITYRNDYIRYEDILQLVEKSDILIDICKPHHNGLSFRIFEALALQKKIITNNIDVINYDFYKPANILVLDYNAPTTNRKLIEDFIKRPSEKIDQAIVQKYYLSSWILEMIK